MNSRQTLTTIAIALLCGGILVVFTDIEVGMVRWFNCGPISTQSEKDSEVCR